MAKQESRPKRWVAACEEARSAFDAMTAEWDNVLVALQSLQDIKAEYEDWQGNLPENLQQSALAEKLEAVVNLDLEPDLDLDAVDTAIGEAEGVELPQGFGRD